MPGRPWLKIQTLRDLFEHEQEIVKRINQTPNGGYLFLTNPLMFLADLGVDLTAAARNELLRLEPRLAAHSIGAYKALKQSTADQRISFRLSGLFERKP